MSGLGWIDFSSQERDQVQAALDALATPGVLDELGVGPVRDAFADRLFPGISTIQTRAKYFTLTAHLLRETMDKVKGRKTSLGFEAYLARREKECRIALVSRLRAPASSEPAKAVGSGIIGGRFGVNPHREVTRRASSIYWNGLREFGFVRPEGLSLAEFARVAVDDRKALRLALLDRGSERGDDADAESTAHLPSITDLDLPDDYLDALSIDLLPGEARQLRYHIKSRRPRSLLGRILARDDALEEIADFTPLANASDKRAPTAFELFCELPSITRICDSDQELGETLRYARLFWRLLEGAHIRYNVLVHSRHGTPEHARKFADAWSEWREEIARDFPSDWDTRVLWRITDAQGVSLRPRTRDFITDWIEETRRGKPDPDRCDKLVEQQERRNKGARARLRPGNPDRENQWVGIRVLDYRQPQACRILRDIRDGLRAGSSS